MNRAVTLAPVRDFFRIHAGAQKKRFSQHEIEAFNRHGWRCFYCNVETPLTSDHIVPVVNGGTDDASNIVPACKTCNSCKGKKDFDEFNEIILAEKLAFETMLAGGDCS